MVIEYTLTQMYLWILIISKNYYIAINKTDLGFCYFNAYSKMKTYYITDLERTLTTSCMKREILVTSLKNKIKINESINKMSPNDTLLYS